MSGNAVITVIISIFIPCNSHLPKFLDMQIAHYQVAADCWIWKIIALNWTSPCSRFRSSFFGVNDHVARNSLVVFDASKSVYVHMESCRIIQHLGRGNDSERRRSQYTSTSAVASLACSTTSSNFMSFAFGSLSLAATSGTDSRKPSKKLLFTA